MCGGWWLSRPVSPGMVITWVLTIINYQPPHSSPVSVSGLILGDESDDKCQHDNLWRSRCLKFMFTVTNFPDLLLNFSLTWALFSYLLYYSISYLNDTVGISWSLLNLIEFPFHDMTCCDCDHWEPTHAPCLNEEERFNLNGFVIWGSNPWNAPSSSVHPQFSWHK